MYASGWEVKIGMLLGAAALLIVVAIMVVFSMPSNTSASVSGSDANVQVVSYDSSISQAEATPACGLLDVLKGCE